MTVLWFFCKPCGYSFSKVSEGFISIAKLRCPLCGGKIRHISKKEREQQVYDRYPIFRSRRVFR